MSKVNSSSCGPRVNVKLGYVLMIIVGHVVNVCAIVMLSSVLSMGNVLPLTVYVIQIALICRYHPYRRTNLYRLYFTYLTGAIIQSILLSRSCLISSISGQH
jgi:hypothetical protein